METTTAGVMEVLRNKAEEELATGEVTEAVEEEEEATDSSRADPSKGDYRLLKSRWNFFTKFSILAAKPPSNLPPVIPPPPQSPGKTDASVLANVPQIVLSDP